MDLEAQMGIRPEPVLSERQLAAHQQAEDAGQDAYIDPTSGLMVMTASGLRRRGRCCHSGCRHCPYRRGVPRPVSSSAGPVGLQQATGDDHPLDIGGALADEQHGCLPI